MFYDIDITTKALDASTLRYTQLTNNVANVDTANYKRADVAFEVLLQQEIDQNGIKDIDINKIEPYVYKIYENTTMRLDGNNVDIDQEMAELSIEKLRYDTLIERVQSQIQRYQYIFQNIR